MGWGSSMRGGGGRKVRALPCLAWVSKRGIWDVPGILPGCPTPLALFKSCAKNVRAHFSFPRSGCREGFQDHGSDQARKRHININFVVRLVLGRPRVFSLFYTVEARQTRGLSQGQTQFVPGTIPGTKGGTESLCEKSLCAFFQKNPRVHKIFVRNSGAGNGCANSMDTWKNCVLSAGKPLSIKFLVLGGGVFWVLGGGGGKCRFYFYGREDFSDFLLAI